MAKTIEIGPYSAYAIAVKNGFSGTEQEWLASLIGAQGPQGASVTGAKIDTSQHLIITVHDPATGGDTEIDAGEIGTTEAVQAVQQAIQQAGQSAVSAVESAGSTQQNAVASAGTQAVSAIGGAQQAAVQQVQQAGQEAITSAQQEAEKAASSATQAGESASAAASSASAAQQSQSAASSSAAQAGESASAAKDSEDAAAASATAAAASESNAEDAADRAEQAAQNSGLPQPTASDAGKVPTVNDAGTGYELCDIVADAYTKAESDARYAPIAAAIRPTVSGNPATLEHSVAWAMQGLSVYGKSTQVTTTGAQLIDTNVSGSANGITWSNNNDGSITVNGTTTDVVSIEFNPIKADAEETYYMFGYASSDLTNENMYLQMFTPDESSNALRFGKEKKVRIIITKESASYLTRIRISPGITLNNVTVFPMVSKKELTISSEFEPYTGGQASPSPDYPQEIHSAGESGSITVTFSGGADQSQRLVISTPNGLPGIPVDSGGNFTDETGQQWVCDEVDFARGVMVSFIAQHTFTGDENFSDNIGAGTSFSYNIGVSLNRNGGLSNKGIYQVPGTSEKPEGNFYIGSTLIGIYTKKSLQEFKSELKLWYTSGAPMVVFYGVSDPTETPLSAEELAAYAALRSYNGTTIVSTEAPVAGLSARYVADGAAYIDGKIQSAVTQAVAAAVSLTGGAQ